MYCDLYSVPEQLARRLLKEPSSIHEFLASRDREAREVALEKSWHGLHFILAGSAWDGEAPLDFIATGGEIVGEEDLGYGPARVLFPDRVSSLNAALAAITDEEFRSRFDPERLASEQIYPMIWDEPLEDLLQEYRGYFEAARSLIDEAARKGHALLITIT